MKRKNEETIWRGTIWSSDLPSKNEEEEGKTIWWRWRNLANEETQEDEKTQNKERSDDEDKKGETWVFKIQVPLGFLSTTPYKSRLKNSIFILELEFLELKISTFEMLVSNIVLQRDN